MQVSDIFIIEDAFADITAMKNAKKIVNDFRSWLGVHNEDTPIEDIMHRYRGAGGDIIFYVNASEFGGPDDLMMGFSHNSSVSGEAYLTAGKNTRTGQVTWFAVMILPEDPAKETDISFKLSSVQISEMLHEIIHYFDRKRQTTPTKNAVFGKVKGVPSHETERYYNSPIEFNAYFQQGMHNVMNHIEKTNPQLGSFEDFKREHLVDFNLSFRQNLNAEYQKKFDRRLYKIYKHLVDEQST